MKNLIKTTKFLIVFMLFFMGCSQAQEELNSNEVCFDNICFEVEVAVKPEDKMRGLMFRESMDEESGMLFIFNSKTKHAFWMKNTLIPLDIIWMDEKQIVVHIEHLVPPCKGDPCPSYQSSARALYVLEVNAGQADLKGIKPGMQATFRLIPSVLK